MGKQLVEIDSELLDAVCEALGTTDPCETVAQALKETVMAYRAGQLLSEDLAPLPEPATPGP
jgi:Arc/MetJ family transcription regulator